MDLHTLGCCALVQPTLRDRADLVRKIKDLRLDIIVEDSMAVSRNEPKSILSYREGKLKELFDLIERL